MNTQDYIRHKAIIYERYKDKFNELTALQIADFRSEIVNAFKFIPHGVQWVEGQPYASVEELTIDIINGNRMRISVDYNDSALLPGELNLKARAVHDWVHYILQAPFTAEGEIRVYGFQRQFHHSQLSKQILFSEVVLQACYAEYFGKFAPVQKVVLYEGKI